MSLTSTQQQVVTAVEGHLVVLAGPGSGKTHTITEKIAYLFEHAVIAEPFGVLAVTFTNAAANLMRTRLRSKGFQAWDRVWIGTFHGLGAYLLGCYGGDIGVSEDFEIIAPKDRKELIRNIASRNGVKDSDLERLISGLKRQGTYPDLDDKKLPRQWVDIFRYYQNYLSENNTLDFDDLIPLAIQLFAKSDLVKRVFTNFFRYVIVDEFQDCDAPQFKLAWGLANAAQGSTIVADDDQAIFGWRGANRKYVYAIEEKLNAERIVLDANFRSDELIVEAAQAVINQETDRVPKQVKAVSSGSGQIYCSGFANPVEEAQRVVELIMSINPEEAIHGWSEMAVITRTGWRVEQVCIKLDEVGIPWFKRENLNFTDSWETTLGLSVLTMACDLNSGEGLYQALIAVEGGGLAFHLDSDDALDVALRIHKNLSENMKVDPTVDDIEEIFRCAKLNELVEAVAANPADTRRRLENLQILVQDIQREAMISSTPTRLS